MAIVKLNSRIKIKHLDTFLALIKRYEIKLVFK